ncbi:hypothetical protein SNE40_005940 [Patella caerulea]|uniref:Uncharacterized protein n=1 Tax=Patella caerulea TaxID=87958 RepID=A0AAN8K1F3_PATCE
MATNCPQPSTSSSTKHYHVRDVLKLLDCDDSEGDEVENTESEDDDEVFRPDEISSSADELSDSDASDDNVPLANVREQAKQQTKTTKRPQYRWKKKPFDRPDIAFTGPAIVPPASMDVDTPFGIFPPFHNR